MADDEIFFPQTQIPFIEGVAVGARLFYNFPLDLVVNIFIFKLPDMVTQFSTCFFFMLENDGLWFANLVLNEFKCEADVCLI